LPRARRVPTPSRPRSRGAGRTGSGALRSGRRDGGVRRDARGGRGRRARKVLSIAYALDCRLPGVCLTILAGTAALTISKAKGQYSEGPGFAREVGMSLDRVPGQLFRTLS
jgi:hypothetical protein